MIGIHHIAEIAALIGDPARANILYALKSDEVISAGSLAEIAGVAHSTASEHLAKLAAAGLVQVRKDGRNRYYQLSSETAAEILENIESLARISQRQVPTPAVWDQVHIHARKCMDHIAGRLGCGIAGEMMRRGHVTLAVEGPRVTETGISWLKNFGIDVDTLSQNPRRLLSICPDWIENAPHLGGLVGAALMKDFVARDWIRSDRGTGATRVTPTGSVAFRREFGLTLRSFPA